MRRVVNWVGVAAGITTLLVVIVSFFIPWWQLTVGDNLVQVNASPVNTHFALFGTQFTVPLLVGLNIASILTLVASGVFMILYSFVPMKSYAKELLGFSYRKPMYALVFFLVSLVAVISIAGLYDLNLPLNGARNVLLPSNLTMGTQVSVVVTSVFLLPFYLTIVAVILSITARLLHGHVVKKGLQGIEGSAVAI